MRRELRVLGLDPGTVTTGYGVLDRSASRLVHVENGLLCAPRGASLEERLHLIHAGIVAVIVRYAPAIVAVEAVFFSKNAQSALTLGHARGVALLAAAQHGLVVVPYPPALVKKTVTGSGRAEKMQVALMVKTLLGLPEPPAEDAADALALAICHCHHDHSPEIRELLR